MSSRIENEARYALLSILQEVLYEREQLTAVNGVTRDGPCTKIILNGKKGRSGAIQECDRVVVKLPELWRKRQ